MYEQGQREPDIWTLAKIADYYGVSMDRLLGRTSVKNEHDVTDGMRI